MSQKTLIEFDLDRYLRASKKLDLSHIDLSVFKMGAKLLLCTFRDSMEVWRGLGESIKRVYYDTVNVKDTTRDCKTDLWLLLRAAPLLV